MTVGVATLGVCLAALIAAAAPRAFAQNCSENGDQLSCALAARKAADIELTAVYSQFKQRGASRSMSASELKTAELAWIAYRDAECKYEASEYDKDSAGNPLPIDRIGVLAKEIEENYCAARIIEAHTKELSCLMAQGFHPAC